MPHLAADAAAERPVMRVMCLHVPTQLKKRRELLFVLAAREARLCVVGA